MRLQRRSPWSRKSPQANNGLLSDLQARTYRRLTRTSAEQWQDLAQTAWDRSQAARQAGNLPAARLWLERARRLAPEDGFPLLALAGLILEQGEAAEAATLFQQAADRHGTPEAWTGLAAARLRSRDVDAARVAVENALRATIPTPALQALAAVLVEEARLEGWCGLDGNGEIHFGPNEPARIQLDGTSVRGLRLPPGWQSAHHLQVQGKSGPFLGSPIPIRAIAGTEGFVEASQGGLSGWAWHPGDPARTPSIIVRGPAGCITLRPEAPGQPARGGRPLAQPRSFVLPAASLEPLGHPIQVTSANGQPLLGSPLDPGLEARSAEGTEPRFAPSWAGVAGSSPRTRPAAENTQIVIPVYRGIAATLACINSVLATVPPDTVIHVIEDASPEPDLVTALAGLAASGQIRLSRQAHNRGFPATANAGIDASPDTDIVLLNSDTLVPPGWLERLRRAAYAAPDIGTATPLSNDATIVSYPALGGGNPVPDPAETARLDALAQQASAGQVADLPVGVGFCLYLRRDCLDQVGSFREDLFAQGYGEENDFCLRARHHGWRHVAALDIFVAHHGAHSFGGARDHLIRRNTTILNRLHPGYDAHIAAHLADDPLAPARRAMDALRWAEGSSPAGAVLMVTHDAGGGVDTVIAARVETLRAQGLRPVILRPDRAKCRVETPDGHFPNLTYAVPGELTQLADLLRPDRPLHLERHHLLGHAHSVLDLARLLDIPIETFVHDYAAFCPRIALVGRERRYCGEPDLAGCEDCIADLGGLLEEDIAVPDLLARSAADLAGSRRIVAPSRDAAARLRRHFPETRPELAPWEDDSTLPPLAPAPQTGPRRICVVGAIGLEKGYEVLLECVRDAARRALPLEFIVCGHTSDDARLLDAGPIFITGPYRDPEAVALIRAQQAQLAFIPSIYPETWCFALSRAWQAGLAAAVFDLGAPAERVRATGRGWVLPLGLQKRAVNDALLSLAPLPAPSQCRN